MKVKCIDKYRCTANKCEYCSRNKNVELKDEFEDCGYEPVCIHYFNDCIYDPAYKLHCHEKGWVKYTESDIEDLKEEVKHNCDCGYGAPWYKSYKNK